MDLLKNYTSDESADETESKPDENSRKVSVDYFNLNFSDSDEDSARKTGSECILDTYSLVKTSLILSKHAYGPDLPERLDIDDKRKLEPVDTVESKDSFEYSSSATKRYRSTNHVSNKKTSEKNSLIGVTTFCHQSLTNKLQDGSKLDENDSDPPQTDIFCERDQILTYLSEEKCCSVPAHSRSFEIHKSSVTSLQWCKDEYSHLLLTASIDSTVKIWDMLSTRTVAQFRDVAAIKSAKWLLCGTKVVYGGYGKTFSVVDVRTSEKLWSNRLEHYVSSLTVHPKMESVILAGTKNNIFAFDIRDSGHQSMKRYSSNCQNVLDIAFFENSSEFVCSTDVVSHDCADRTLMVWDFATSAILSNQIYAECYTCPCVRVEPGGQHFVAQSNGDYIVMFKTKRPYKRRNRRYGGHKVSGYGVTCDFSPDGKYIASGDAGGGLYVYLNENCSLVRKLNVKTEVPTVQVSWHPVLHKTIATASLDGFLQIWQ